MKIDLLLIYPSMDVHRLRDSGFNFGHASSGHGGMPLSAVSLAPYLSREGFVVKVLDFDLYSSEREDSLLRKHLPNTNMVGISAMTAHIPHALKIAADVKRYSSTIPIVFGGIHASLLPEQTVQHPLVDWVVVGEGEEPLKNLLLGKPFPTLISKKNKYIGSHSLSFISPKDLPDVDYSAVEMDAYFQFQGGERNIDFVTSRGCPFRCSFCVNTIMRNNWRAYPVERVCRTLKEVVAKYSAKHVFFMDENFFGQVERAKVLIDYVSRLNVTWEANACVKDILGFSDDFFGKIRSSGCIRLRMGAESASDRLLAIIKKNITCAQTAAARDACLRNGITPVMSFMINLPDELPVETELTMAFAEQCRKSGAQVIGPQTFRPYPGSEEFNKLVGRGLKIPNTLDGWAHSELFNTLSGDAGMRKYIRKLFPRQSLRAYYAKKIYGFFKAKLNIL